MDAELKKIKKLTAFMRKAGILSLKSGDLELSLSPNVFHEEHTHPSNDASSDAPEVPQQVLTDEEILFWSAPGALPGEPESELN